MRSATTLALVTGLMASTAAQATCAHADIARQLGCLARELEVAQADATGLAAGLDAAEADLAGIEPLADYLEVDSATDAVRFVGANVYVQSGAGGTHAAVNGRGNLIVGYDEDNGDTKSGSHNLVVGRHHTYTSYSGLVAGSNNAIIKPVATVSGGFYNTASGAGATVSGGMYNFATGPYASVTAGNANVASAPYSTVSGGLYNAASGDYSSVTGGWSNAASAPYATVSGGRGNLATGTHSSVTGGWWSEAAGHISTVAGGNEVIVRTGGGVAP
jgi:hypothetical protein